jgi:hypothetical protein
MPNIFAVGLRKGLRRPAYDGLKGAIAEGIASCGLGLTIEDVAVYPVSAEGTCTDVIAEIHGFFSMKGRGSKAHAALKQAIVKPLQTFIEAYMPECFSMEVAMGSGLMKPKECLLYQRPKLAEAEPGAPRPWKRIEFNPNGSIKEEYEI